MAISDGRQLNFLRSRYRQNELKSERAQRAVPRSYYWIDYQNFCNVVKWRVSAMRRGIEQKLRNVSILSRIYFRFVYLVLLGIGQQGLYLHAVPEEFHPLGC